MKIDFKKLQKVEKEYHYDNPVCQNTLQTMVDLVLSNPGVGESLSYVLAVKTLTDLGILVEDVEKPKVQQLNS